MCRLGAVALILLLPILASAQRNCNWDGKSYDHLEVFLDANGCSKLQCQNNETVVITEKGCQDQARKCYAQNLMWKVNSDLFQCIYKAPWGWTISKIFIDEPEPIPVCVNPGKDVYFVLDASTSIGKDNFQKQREFTAQLTRRFFIGRNKSNAEYLFGGVLFSTNASLMFDLNTHLANDPLYKTLLAVPYNRGGTETDVALNFIVDRQLFSAASGDRSDVENYVILMTDGQSKNPTLTKAAAKLVRQVATILSVGVGSGVNNAELLDIAGVPENVFNIASFDVLKQVQERISEKICKIQAPSENGR